MIFNENGLIENFQIAVCAVAAILFFTTANRQLMKSRLDQSAVSFFLGLIPFSGIGRELSFGAVLGMSSINVTYTQAIMASVLITILLLALVLLAISISRDQLHLEKSFAGVHLVFISLFCIAAGQVFEHGTFGMPHSQMLEEISEAIGYLILLYLSFHRVAKSAH